MSRLLDRLVHVPGMQRLWMRLGVGSIHTRMRYDIIAQPWYAFGVYYSAMLAKQLGLPAISVIELGVAGGRGLVALEHLAIQIEREVGVAISVLGFDSGKGMPPPTDYRDMPHVWGEGFYSMDEAKLRARLSRAELVLGDVGETIPQVLARDNFPPIGFVAFDLDYYSSTMTAFSLFEGPAATHLPRVYCYFDDVTGSEWMCMSEFVGELAAMKEFNEHHRHQKIGQLVNLRLERAKPAKWNEQIFVFHDFSHPLYTMNIAPKGAWREIPLR